MVKFACKLYNRLNKTHFGTDPLVQHPYDGGSLAVGDQIEYFVDLVGMSHRYFDGVRTVQRVQVQRTDASVLTLNYLYFTKIFETLVLVLFVIKNQGKIYINL